MYAQAGLRLYTRSLISTFVFCCLQTSEDRFSRVKAHIVYALVQISNFLGEFLPCLKCGLGAQKDGHIEMVLLHTSIMFWLRNKKNKTKLY